MTEKPSRRQNRSRPKRREDQYREIIVQMLRDVEGLERMQSLQSRLMAEVRRRLKMVEKAL